MNFTALSIFVGFLLIGALQVVGARYTGAPDANSSLSHFWRLDRLTGAVSYCLSPSSVSQVLCIPGQDAEAKPRLN